MLNQNERWVLYYDTVLKSVPKEAPKMPMLETLQLVEQAWKSGDAVWIFQNESAALRIQDMKHLKDDDVYVMLVSFADKNMSDPVFAHLDKGTLRVEPKLDGEGVALSAHLVISTKPKSEIDPIYMTLLEDIPRVGKTNLRSFLTFLFKKSSNFRFKTEDGSTRNCRPTIEIDGHMGQSFKDDLRDGSSLLGFELVQYKNKDGEFDESGFLQETKRQVVIDIEKKFEFEDAVEISNRLLGRAKNSGYHDMRVRYKRPEGNQKSIMVGTHREDAGDALTVKSELITVANDLPQCSERIQWELANKITRLLVSIRDAA